MDAIAATKNVSFSVPGGTRAAGVARRSVLSVQAGLPGPIRHRLALLLIELVTNAIQYGGAGSHDAVQVRRVRVEVLDPGANGAVPRDRVETGGGYGLMLVDRLSDDWGRQDTGGTLAWFELSLDHFGDA